MIPPAILETLPLGLHWPASDPFLFCAHHLDAYPSGNDLLGPTTSLAGRDIGQDFAGLDGWRMYHGEVVPGFPAHPHRGFETVTIVQRGVVDHSDSLGATARFGRGDVQWLTAGRGIVHSEMFPLLDSSGPNPLEIFQIWLNLPAAGKMCEPYFTMIWGETLPAFQAIDEAGRRTQVTVVAGPLDGVLPPACPPESWAAHPGSDVGIWVVRMEPQARWQLPPTAPGSNRTVYFFEGSALEVADHAIGPATGVKVRADIPLVLRAGPEPCHVLVLQGRPIGEPVAQYGPFVMNQAAEIHQAIADYRATEFGGWPWPSQGPVHPQDQGRFARHPGGRIDGPPTRPAPDVSPNC